MKKLFRWRWFLMVMAVAVCIYAGIALATQYDIYGMRGLIKGFLQIGTGTPGNTLGAGDLFVSDDAEVGGDALITGATTFGASVGVTDWTGLQPLMALANVETTYSAVNTTTDAYALTVLEDSFDAGEAIAIDFSGEASGGNAATGVLLALDGTDAYTLSMSTATGEFSGRILINQVTVASQRIAGWASTEDDGYHQAEYGTAAADFSAGDVAVKLRVKSANAGDTISLHTQNWVLMP